jgi:hypothetical protein
MNDSQGLERWASSDFDANHGLKVVPETQNDPFLKWFAHYMSMSTSWRIFGCGTRGPTCSSVTGWESGKVSFCGSKLRSIQWGETITHSFSGYEELYDSLERQVLNTMQLSLLAALLPMPSDKLCEQRWQISLTSCLKQWIKSWSISTNPHKGKVFEKHYWQQWSFFSGFSDSMAIELSTAITCGNGCSPTHIEMPTAIAIGNIVKLVLNKVLSIELI